MKKAVVILSVFASLAAWAFFQAAPAATGVLAGYCPPGALLYLESRDFSALVRDWNGSAEKRLWLQSANYEVFSRSRLFGRLEDAHGEFALAAGIAPNMALVESIAGGNSALALYDIGKLEFLYLTRLPSARAMESALWKMKSKFEPRSAGGREYYVRIEPTNRRVAAFAVVDDLLLLATREDLMAGAVTLIGGQAGGGVKSEGWFDQSTRAAGAAGDVRMVLNMAPLLRSPHFRSYWIQENVSDLRQYAAAVIDAHRSAAEIREERVLLKSAAGEGAAADETPVAQILRLAPGDAGFYRAWATPSRAMIAGLIEQKILNPASGGDIRSNSAPAAPVEAAAAGSEADLETRIDEPPLVLPRFSAEPLRSYLESVTLEAALQVQSSHTLSDGVFIDNEPVIVLQAASDWDAGAARTAIAACNAGRWGAEFGVSAQGRVLAIGKSDRALQPVLGRISRPALPQGAAYIAVYRHPGELAAFTRMMRLMDNPAMDAPRQPRFAPRQAGEGEAPPREPQFFSENIASLGRALGRVKSATIVVHDRGQSVAQSVTYRLQ